MFFESIKKIFIPKFKKRSLKLSSDLEGIENLQMQGDREKHVVVCKIKHLCAMVCYKLFYQKHELSIFLSRRASESNNRTPCLKLYPYKI